MTAGRDVLVTGGTGYVGRRLISALSERGHRVRALARPESAGRVPRGAQTVVGDALDPGSVGAAMRASDTVVHLVGTPHPSPAKAAQFVSVDLASVRAAVAAATAARAEHFVYVSVAHPAPVMEAYVSARVEGERLIRAATLTATVLRPWYVTGPGHWWPLALAPVYALAALLPWTREGARQLGLVTLAQMVAALVRSVESPPRLGTVRTLDVPAIREGGP